MDDLTPEQLEALKKEKEKIIRVYYRNLDKTIAGFGHNVDLESLRILRGVLTEKVAEIDRVLGLLGG